MYTHFVKKAEYTIGIDEAGRGPLAGPVAVGVALVKSNFSWTKELPGVNDSKKLSASKRDDIFLKAKQLKKKGLLDYQVVLMSAQIIDRIGIVPAITKAMHQGLKKIMQRSGLKEYQVFVKLDGGLRAPATYISQETIIKGDAKEKVIGLASIMAKVTRDQYMEKLAVKKEFVVYDFAKHKGYGTKIHRESIAGNGLSLEHRVSFCRNIKLKAN